MRGLGMFLLLIGIGVGLVFNIIVGGILAIVGLLMVIASGGSAKPASTTVCEACGNPVAKTANLCPTCGTKLVATEGPLAPPRTHEEQVRHSSDTLGIFLAVSFVGCLVSLLGPIGRLSQGYALRQVNWTWPVVLGIVTVGLVILLIRNHRILAAKK